MILINSTSAGRTSQRMAKYMMDEHADKYEMIINVFANTGREREESLLFVHNCDQQWGYQTVWVEAVIDPELGKGTRHRLVTFETAAREGDAEDLAGNSPFENAIKKYGIFNAAYPNCTDRLKLAPIYSYLKSIGLEKGDYVMALGIRADEYRRVNPKAADENIIYPFVDLLPTTKLDVNNWWKQQPFDLGLLEHHGNCKACWKKSLKKHLMLIKEMPEIYDFTNRMEEQYGLVGQTGDSANISRVMFRKNRSTKDLFKLSPYHKDVLLEDANSECGESCELFPMESINLPATLTEA